MTVKVNAESSQRYYHVFDAELTAVTVKPVKAVTNL